MKKPTAKTNRPLTVMVLDDSRAWRDLVKSILEAELGISPLVAASGQQALAILNTVPVDVVVSDLSMPEMSGMEFLNRARPLFPNLEFVMMTADLTAATMAAEFVGRGALALISKDDIDPKLVELLRNLMKSV